MRCSLNSYTGIFILILKSSIYPELCITRSVFHEWTWMGSTQELRLWLDDPNPSPILWAHCCVAHPGHTRECKCAGRPGQITEWDRGLQEKQRNCHLFNKETRLGGLCPINHLDLDGKEVSHSAWTNSSLSVHESFHLYPPISAVCLFFNISSKTLT